jgi:hypothetical protein
MGNKGLIKEIRSSGPGSYDFNYIGLKNSDILPENIRGFLLCLMRLLQDWVYRE